MALRPHDLGDLMLAPVLLSLEERIEELGQLSQSDLEFRVALDANIDTHEASRRPDGLQETIIMNVDLHGWTTKLVERGLEVSHGEHRFVLGLPRNMHEFLNA